MSEQHSFKSDSKFYALEHFPFGIDRSGEFTRDQALLLEQHGYAYQALSSGERQPVTAEERDFVAVFNGEKPATTAHEKAWLRFCNKIDRGPAISAFGGFYKSVSEPFVGSAGDLGDQDW
jgi:hypothetical protein